MAGVLERLDAQIEQLFASWNLWSTLLLLTLTSAALYTFLAARDPDTHPYLLSRQCLFSQVRQPGESGVCRYVDTPHGLPLKSGLNLRDGKSSKYAPGKDGDIRDIWKRVVDNVNTEGGSSVKLQTILGRERITQHDTADLTRQINAIGTYIGGKQYRRVATHLPNTIELLLTVISAAFYGFEVVLVPYGYGEDALPQVLENIGASLIIANAGSLPLSGISDQCKQVKEVFWVTEDTTRHIDFEDDDDDIATLSWHDLVSQQSSKVSTDLPRDSGSDAVAPDVVFVSSKPQTLGEMTVFTQKNLVAAIAAQVHALPIKEQLGPTDVFLPTDSLTNHYILVQTLAALFSGAAVALNSVAGEGIDLPAACAGVAPTVIAASAPSLLKLYKQTSETVNSNSKKLALRSQTQALRAGYMPPRTILSAISSPTRIALGNVPHKLRLIYVFERSDTERLALNPDALAELRAFTGARVIHALTVSAVAGVVAQTVFYDYRNVSQLPGPHAHFGPPISCVEIKLVDTESHKTVRDHDPEGEIVVSGPAVINGEYRTGVAGTVRRDGTLALL